MTHRSPQTLQIGMIGHTALLQQNVIRFRRIQEISLCHPPVQIVAVPIFNRMQIAELDGLLITGWQPQSLFRQIKPLQKNILAHLDSLSIWGIAAGAAMLGQNGLLPAIDCRIRSFPGHMVSTSILEFPDYPPKRFVGYFVPEISFVSPAPNLGILCQNETHGIVAVRQGNHLASSFAAELTPQLYLYQYWLEMVSCLKEWKI